MVYPRPLSVDSMDLDLSWTPLHRLYRVDCRDLTCCCCRFLGGCPWDSKRMSVSTLFWSLRMLSIALHIVGCDCTTSDRKPLFQDLQMLLVLDPPCIVVTCTFHSSGGNLGGILHILIGGWCHLVLLAGFVFSILY